MITLHPASTNISLTMSLIDPTTNGPKTGLAYGDLTLDYIRAGAADVTAAAVQQTNGVAGAHIDKSAIEIDATNSPGEYRIDWIDAAFAVGVGQVVLLVQDAADTVIGREVVALNSDTYSGATAVPEYTVTAGGSPLEGVTVDLSTDIGGTNRIQSAVTNASGKITAGTMRVNLAVGTTVYLWRAKAGYTFTDPDTEVLT